MILKWNPGRLADTGLFLFTNCRMAVSTTEIVAWWGAILATVVFVWDIIKWRLAGPKLRLTIRSSMKTINVPEYEGKTLLIAEVVNYGDRPTTITLLTFFYYRNRWNWLRNQADQKTAVMVPNTRQSIPFELRPGNSWSGFAIQDKAMENAETLEKMAREGYLFCAIYHSHSTRPLRQRVLIR
jgi:hypothetical protein